VPVALVAAPSADRPAAGTARSRVSLCVIVKDEEENLPACLGSCADLVDEVIVVDTGSTDRTKEVAARYGAKVFDFPWVDDFAAARNESLRHATGDYIFWLDADDRLDEDNHAKLRALFASLHGENVAYAMKCLCLPDQETGVATVVDHVRLFRNDPAIRWQFRVHEQILPAVRESGGQVRWADVVLQHTGYQDPALRRRKSERDLRLLHLQDTEQPDHPFTLFNLGSVYQDLGRLEEAVPLLGRSLMRSQAPDSIVRKAYALLAQCQRRLGRAAEALAVCTEGRRLHPDDAELLFQEALARQAQGDLEGSGACYLRLLGSRPGEHFASLDPGVRGYKARHNLAALYRAQGRLAEAEAQWRAALAEQPGFVPAQLELAEVLLAQGRVAEAEPVMAALEAGPLDRLELGVLRARLLLRRREFAPCRQLLGEVIGQAPEAERPRELLSHCLLQEGRDWPAAEQALRDVLALNAHNAEARRNLAVLLRQLGRADAGLAPGGPATAPH